MFSPAAGSSPLDTTVLVSTPENVAFDFRLAGPFPRALAFLLDFLLLGFVLFCLTLGLALLGSAGIGILLFIGFALWWGYGGLMEAFWNGQTLGKKALGIRVVSESGLAINAGQAMLRNVLRSADLFPPFFPGVVAMLFGSRFQRMGDLAAGTMVVLEGQRSSPRPPVVTNVKDQTRDRIPPQFRPDTATIDALAAYVSCRLDLSPARRHELSLILAQHFITAWSLPPRLNPDQLLCAIYEFATVKEENRKTVCRRDVDDDERPANKKDRQHELVLDHLRNLEDTTREGR